MAIKRPKCHYENPETKQFCADCGTQLIPQSKDVPPEVTETLQTPVHIVALGTVFVGRYEILEKIGEGGMGRRSVQAERYFLDNLLTRTYSIMIYGGN